MTITVEKSPNLRLNKSSSEALTSILATLEKQNDLVKEVKVLSNFSMDHDATLLFGRPIVKGIVVVVDKEYQLSEHDMAWFHPSIGRGRSLFKIEQPLTRQQLTAVSGMNSSLGEYTITKQDEFGSDQVEHRLIIDTANDETLFPLYKKWLQQRATAGDVDKQWKRMKLDDVYSLNEYTKKMRADTALAISPGAELLMSDTIHNVMSDSKHVYFINDATNESPTILVKTSALGGYRTYKNEAGKQNFIAASMGSSDTFYSWKQMSTQNMQRIETACSWDGEINLNTQVMRPPLSTDVRSFEQEYGVTVLTQLRMRLAQFSKSDDIVDKMNPRDVFNITPSQEHSEHGHNYITAPVNMDHIMLRRLMEKLDDVQDKFKNFHLFNTQAVQGGRLILPREIYDYLA